MILHRSTASPLYRSYKGTVLLLSLLIMSSVVISSAGLGSLILSSLQQSRTIDNSMIAYYAAESAIEDALYTSRRLETVPGDVTGQAITNGAKWTRTVTTLEPVIYTSIPENSLMEVALFDPDNETNALNIRTVKIDWSSTCTGACPVLSATLVSWQPQNPIIWNPNAIEYKFTSPPAVLSVDTVANLYKLRLRAEKNSLQDVRIQAFEDDGLTVPANLPGRIRISASGDYVGTKQKITVSIPRRAPLSSVYDFVVFSECSLVKGGAGISCPP